MVAETDHLDTHVIVFKNAGRKLSSFVVLRDIFSEIKEISRAMNDETFPVGSMGSIDCDDCEY